MAKKSVALFGGAFDPPHLGHRLVAAEILNKELVDEVWFVPVFQHPWADKLGKHKLAAYKDRVSMLTATLVDNSQVAHFKNVSFVLPTINYFKEKFPEVNFSWVMGSEYLPKFHLFLETHPKLSREKIYIYPRANYSLKPLYKNMVGLKELPQIEISSSQIRAKLQQKENISQLVTPKVFEYIKQHNLYF